MTQPTDPKIPHSALRTLRSRRGGPKTEEGKRRSSLNNLKHGLYATSRQALEQLAAEAGVEFDQVLERMRNYFRPADPLEEDLVRRIARCSWRLAHAEAMERRVIKRNPAPGSPGASYDKVLRFERLVDIHLHRAIAALTRKRELEIKHNQRYELPPRFS